MKLTLAPILAAIMLSLALPAMAQAATPAAAKAAKPAKKSVKKAVAAPAETPPPAASDEQKSAAAMAYVGEYACEFDEAVNVSSNPKYEGYLDMSLKKQHWVMKPVLSSTGALRLEDVTGRMLMIQIANKSMVMDTKIGQRLVDGCMHEKQREFAKTMVPAESMLGK